MQPHAGIVPTFLEDLPEVSDQQLWSGVASLAESLAALIPQLPTSHPVLLAGAWGSGKTTLLRALQRRLEAAGTGSPIWFEAWRCEGEGFLLPELVRTVWEQSPRDEAQRSLYVQARRAAWILAMRGVRVAAALAGQSDLIDAVGTPADFRADMDATEQMVATPERSPAATLHDTLTQLIARSWPSSAEGGRPRPVVFIDDLDRCTPAQTVAFVEQLRAIIARSDAVPCQFVLAVDREVLVRAIANKFANLGSYDGNRYLEKVFPLVFTLPSPDGEAVRDLLQKLLSCLGGPRDQEPGMWREALGTSLCKPEFANPRLMKRCLNRFMLVRYFEARVGDPYDPVKAAVLAEWLAATDRWPVLRRVAHLPEQAFARMQTYVRGESGLPLGADLEALVHEPGAADWLRSQFLHSPERRAQLTAAERRLRRWGL